MSLKDEFPKPKDGIDLNNPHDRLKLWYTEISAQDRINVKKIIVLDLHEQLLPEMQSVLKLLYETNPTIAIYRHCIEGQLEAYSIESVNHHLRLVEILQDHEDEVCLPKYEQSKYLDSKRIPK